MKIFSAFFILFFFVSCQDIKDVPRPENLIQEDKMVAVLVDVSLLHGARIYNRRLLQEKGVEPYEYLWEKHKIDSVQFRKSNEYYAANYRQYQSIYEKVKARLEILQVEYDSLREAEERRRDSLRAVEEKDTLHNEPFRDTTSSSMESFRLPPPVSRRDSVE